MIETPQFGIKKTTKNVRHIENEYLQIWEENGIIFEVFKPGVMLDIDAAKKCVEDRMIVSNNITMPIFADTRQLVNMNLSARQYLAGEKGERFLCACAVLTDNILNRLLVNTYIKIDRPTIPTKAFTDRSKALQWLEFFKNQN